MRKNILAFRKYLDREGFHYQYDEEREFFSLNFGLDNGSYRVVAKIEEGRDIQAFAYSPIKVPEGSRPEIAIAIAKANYGLKVGNFELDLTDGELRYQAIILFEETFPSDQMLDLLIHVSLGTLDKYMPAFLSIIYSNEPAVDAVSLVEAS